MSEPLTCDKCSSIPVVPYHPGGPLFKGIRFCPRHAELLRLVERLGWALEIYVDAACGFASHSLAEYDEARQVLNRYKAAMEKS